MTWWKAGAGLLAATLLVLSAPTAVSAPIGDPVAPIPGSPALMELEITQLTPRVVTSATTAVTVTGKVTNISDDRRIAGIQARVQRGTPLETDRDLRDAGGKATDAANSPFQDISEALDPGQSADVSLSVPISGEGSLRLDQPGVYPMLINVNGRPDYGGQARLAAVSIALPVLSVPAGAAAAPKPTPPDMTILWPLLDEKPRRLPTPDGTTLLSDDELADSLAVGGRLFSLVNAVTTTTDSTLAGSLCFAVDPDLLETVAAMSTGYRVRTRGGQLVDGKGADAATDWLTSVRDLTRGRCVFAVPYADADLVALSRAGAVDLANLSLTSSASVSDLLAPVQPAKGVFWPAGGSVDQQTLLDLAGLGPATVLTDPAHLQNPGGRLPYTLTGPPHPSSFPVRALPVDSLISDSLASESTQKGIAALIHRTAFDGAASQHVLIAPPRRWTASSEELDQFLTVARQLFDDGFARPRSLIDVIGEPSPGTATGLNYTPLDTTQEVPPQVTAEVMRINATNRDMRTAMVDDNTNRVDPNELLAPIQYGLLRSASTAWRGQTAGALELVNYVDGQLDGLRQKVVVNNPSRPLALASGDSPIPVNIFNGLPVTILVRINLAPAPGLRPAGYPDLRIPPLSSRTATIPAEVIRAGRFTVDVRLTTPGGTPLGSTTRLELTSTSYGIISIAVTGTAAGVLVLLVGVRIFRRVKAARANDAVS